MCRDTKQDKKAIDEAKLKAITDRISKKKAEAVKGLRTTKQLDRPSISKNEKKRIMAFPLPIAKPLFTVKRTISPPMPIKKLVKEVKKSKK